MNSLSLALKALRIADTKVGLHEEGGPNQGPIVEWSMRPWSQEPLGAWAKWCCAFVCSCYLEADSLWIRRFGTASVSVLWSRCRKAGLTSCPNRACPQPGDLVFFGQLDHIGLVVSMEGETLHTIEGNHDNQVARLTHSLRDPYLFGFARIPE